MALHDGIDPATGVRIGIRTGDPATCTTFDEVFAAFERQLRHLLDVKIRGNRIIERLYATYMPAPFLSLLIDDCIATGTDYNAGGARYNTTYIMPVGIGTVTDGLSAIRAPRVRAARRHDGRRCSPRSGTTSTGDEALRQRLWNQHTALRQRRPRGGHVDAPRVRRGARRSSTAARTRVAARIT